MKKHLLMGAIVLLAFAANAQLRKNRGFITLNTSFSYSTPGYNTTTGNGTSIPSLGENKDLAGSWSLMYGSFVKDFRSVNVGVYGNYSEAASNSETAYLNSEYSQSGSDRKSMESGLLLETQRFIPIWNERFFVSINTGFSMGIVTSESSDYNIYTGSTTKNSYKHSSESDGKIIRANIGAGAYFFINKHWCLSTKATIFGFRYENQDVKETRSDTQTQTTFPFAIGQSDSKTTRNSNTFEASLNPFVRPFSLAWGVSYFF